MPCSLIAAPSLSRSVSGGGITGRRVAGRAPSVALTTVVEKRGRGVAPALHFAAGLEPGAVGDLGACGAPFLHGLRAGGGVLRAASSDVAGTCLQGQLQEEVPGIAGALGNDGSLASRNALAGFTEIRVV